ncbi:hypothetical protein [Actinacidiphila reveromycinica]|nr:hypothetical protein [Streptomyces sp. SN-593]
MEIGEYAFHEENQLDAVLIPRLARRIHAAFAAKANRKTVYLEHGSMSGS